MRYKAAVSVTLLWLCRHGAMRSSTCADRERQTLCENSKPWILIMHLSQIRTPSEPKRPASRFPMNLGRAIYRIARNGVGISDPINLACNPFQRSCRDVKT